ncbi:MAG: protein kinase [Lysobacterales bacterium]
MAEPSLARLRALFEAVVELPEAQRATALAALEAEPALAERVLRMVRDSEAEATSEATRVQRRLAGLDPAAPSAELGVGDILGAWKLVDVLGEGGMGAVFLAERADGHFQQRAAVKLLRGHGSDGALRLLAAERQILAQLNHPNIARLLDGGATPLGRPYLVMEHIEGERLDRYLAQAAPPLDARLVLFRLICEAVAFAHAQLIVHCDLKPSNVLIDGAGRPRLLDFGIARLLDADASSGGMVKAYTPGYASPELQAGLPVGTPSDVYSLGVLLRGMVGDVQASRGDLGAIIDRATRPDPQARYTSVQALSDDIERLRQRYPVQARTPTAGYRALRLLQRRWPAFAVTTGALVLLLAAGWQLKLERDRALAEAARADREAATAGAINGFLESIIAGADVQKEGSRDMTVVEMVDRGYARIGTELAEQPATQATLYDSLARVYDHLGRTAQGRAASELAIEIERTVQPPRPLVLSNLLRNRAVALADEQRYADAEPLAREALALAEAHADPMSRDVGQSATAVALSLGNSGYEEAKQLLLRHLQIRKVLGEPEIDLASTWHNLGLNAMRAGWLEEADDYLQRSFEVRRAVLGPGHARTQNGAAVLATVKTQLRRFDEAMALRRDMLEHQRALQGENGRMTLFAEAELASSFSDLGEFMVAAAMQQSVIDRLPAANLTGSADHARYVGTLGVYFERAGQLTRAAAAQRESLALRLALYQPDDPAVARTQANLGRVLMLSGQLDEAAALLEKAQATRAAKLTPTQADRLEGELLLAELALLRGEPEGSVRQLDTTAALMETASGVPARAELSVALLRARIAAAEGPVEDMEQQVERCRSLLDRVYPEGNPWRLSADLALLEVQASAGLPVAEEAKSLETRIAALPKSFAPDSVFLNRVRALWQHAL